MFYNSIQEISRIANSQGRNEDQCLPRARVGWLGVDEGSIIKECRASLCCDEDILKLIVVMVKQLGSYTKTSELYTLGELYGM